MAFVCDAHVHLYLGYDLVPAARAASTRLDLLFREACGDLSAQPVRICCLAERFDCHYFRDLREGRLSLNAAGAQCRPCAEDGGLCLTFADGEQLILIAGRQINTVERLEVIALGASPEIADHALSFGAAAAAIRDAGGIPVINWAPGKWFFSRGRLVRTR
ncbi:MAG TPA: hypothetical protein PLP17_13570 [Oligoflexia bacterium]|nr:hypothetical protein [Oligoflexia bacterium]